MKQPCCASAWSESCSVEIRRQLMREDAAYGTGECCCVCGWVLPGVGGQQSDIKIQRWRELRYQVGGYWSSPAEAAPAAS